MSLLPVMTIRVKHPDGTIHDFGTRLQAGSKWQEFHLGSLCYALQSGVEVNGFKAQVLLDGEPVKGGAL